MIRSFAFLIILLLLSGCSMIKNIKLIKAGEVTEESFYHVIDFREHKGYIIITATIQGEEFDFILDSGAPNLISKSLADQLGLTMASESKAIDSRGHVGFMEIVTMDTIKIGSLAFTNTAALVYALDSITELHCMNVDGLIGSNLMRHAIWDISYSEEKIIITDDRGKLNIPENAPLITFTTSVQGSPYFHANYDDIKIKNILFDLGSGGNLSVPQKSFNKIINREATTPIKGYGARSFGVFGSCYDTSYYALIQKIHMGNIPVDSVLMSTEKNSRVSPILGTSVLRHYDFVIDWQRKEILLRNRDPGHRLKKSFGFGYGLEENELKVMFVFDNSPASNAGITAGTQILEIYGKDVEELSLEGYCSIRNFNFEEETIFLRIKKGDSSREVKLAKEYLFK